MIVLRTVGLPNDAPDAFVAARSEGKDLSDLLLRLAGASALLSPYAGAWSTAPDGEIQKIRVLPRDAEHLSRAPPRRPAGCGHDYPFIPEAREGQAELRISKE